MQILPVPSSLHSPGTRQYLSSFVVNDTVAIDAGGIGFGLSLEQQKRIKHVVLSHSHMDHIASLPIFLDCVYDGSGDCVTIHATATTLEVLRTDVFNNRVWPDFIEISKNLPPYLKLSEMPLRQPMLLNGVRITAIPVNHVVDAVGFIVEDGDASVVFSCDTGPTDELWQAARALPKLDGVFIEVTFPDELSRLAEIAKHLTPALVREEISKLPADTRIFAVHIHNRHRAAVEAELARLKLPKLEITHFGRTYDF